MIPTPSRHPLRRDGTTQAARENAALNPGSGLLDDRDLAHLLTTATRAAELLTFTALNNRADGTWRDFIAGTVPAALAELTLSSSRQLELELAASRPASPTDANLELRAIRLRELCVELDTTLQTFRRGGSPFADTVERVITHQVCDALKAALATATAAHFAEWQQASSILTAAPWQIPFPAAPAPTTVIAAEGGLEGLAAALIAARAMLAASAEIALEAGTADTGGQPPHMALVLAFLELFGVAQAGLDDLVRRHLEFYYTRKLLIHPRGPVMDRSFVLFEPVKGSQPHG